ncbi:hypothetical protein ANRL3_00270 [Anaerolineae bacterium]|nr:hypothetical protein ANRL3_00270 [Anaerolineae bacterium]
MTHTLHRKGEAHDLSDDHVLLAMAATGITHKGSAETKRKMFEILAKHPHANCGDVKTGSLYNSDFESILAGFQDTSVLHFVFPDKETVIRVLEDLKAADLGLSVVITGLFDDTQEACQKSGLGMHTVEYSGGIFGRTEKLAPDPILEITTMCGHGLVAANLVLENVKLIRKGKKTCAAAAAELAAPCLCGIFNPQRAERLLAKLV